MLKKDVSDVKEVSFVALSTPYAVKAFLISSFLI
jgi:hypothetical protein